MCVSHSFVSNSCDSMDCRPPGSSVHGIFQARILEWVAISFSRGSLYPGVEPKSPAFQVDSLALSHKGRRSRRRYYSLLNTPTLQEVMWMAWTSMQSINQWMIQSIYNFKFYSNKAHRCTVNTWLLEALFSRLITVQLVNCSEDNPIDCLNNWYTRNYIVF